MGEDSVLSHRSGKMELIHAFLTYKMIFAVVYNFEAVLKYVYSVT